MSIHGVLGESTSYPKSYAPDVLYPIARSLGRDEIAKTGFAGDYQGVDVWQAFEVSWLDLQGVSQVATARFEIPASSPNIVESKSLKLYLNSLNFTEFANAKAVQDTITKDLSACVGANVAVALHSLDGDDFTVQRPLGECIDQALQTDNTQKVALSDDIDSTFLQGFRKLAAPKSYALYSDLLRSNCPVTNQPDWGTVQISITTNYELNHAAILRYVLSYRQHNGFHEQCVEQIFADFMQNFAPTSLKVQANYTRRGGIDINPVRVFNAEIGKVGRFVRQ
ncbi:NADPH-dependent 7-cyano-7-deazaguanine reductase QueF [Moraxella caviae]|uniref:NADPH-dependent 7-cyano-7-deazaguanine reductase n=1 Tax=Moraxella caviae TaxID=34060 RepID=A0A1S9ZWB0_9GAMM|nr:NADPH-dependent 7-cyano-7-deazaguanine reductase QueF [Moraxella caviae]OOR87710.1 NADPH-dependent 7-cyano-7-deazaguanine reductase QueF [Moraxella caviae]STZ10119.1 NADPH-dependent 7-cyano-7-deazaguanine reductase [Moraxella caviae]VEW11112.1 NADPH-dependent 7-cyano-7-deazaguanine reductase [Moraxella caviae]